MSSAARPDTNHQSLPPPSDAPVRDWVNALAAGTCSNVDFLRHFRDEVRKDTEIAWEALSLLDQGYRTRHIARDVYIPIKAYLERFAIGQGDRVQPQSIAQAVPQPVAHQPQRRAHKVSALANGSAAALRVGDTLRNRFRIIGILGGGGAAGTVVEAIDDLYADMPDVSQRVAIRVREMRDLDQAGQLAAYLRHVCRIQAFAHPNLTRIYNVDQDQGRLLLTMELLAGSKLSQLAAKPGAAQTYVLDRHHIVQCIASALQYVHAQGIAHGNLRAAEIFITHSGEVRLLGLECSFDQGADAQVKDHRDFAACVYGLLADDPDAALLHRPGGLTDRQWQLLSAVSGGDDTAGAELLQQFSMPRTAPAEMAASEATQQFAKASADRKNLLRGIAYGSVAMFGFFGVAYLALDRASRQPPVEASVATQPAAAASTPAAPGVALPTAEKAAVNAAGQSATARAAASGANRAANAAPPVSTARVSTIDWQREIVEVVDGQTVARLRAQRRGAIGKVATFKWWTESGTALPDVDFHAVTPRVAQFPAGAATIELFVALLPNPDNKLPRAFFVQIDAAGEGVESGARTLAQVSIIPPGYVAPATEDASTAEPIDQPPP